MKVSQVQITPKENNSNPADMVDIALSHLEQNIANDRAQVDKEYNRSQSTLQAQAQAERDITRLREEQAQVRIDTYSDAKGREQNAQYGEYLNGSIQENFEEQIRLAQERANLIREIAALRSQLQVERTTVEMELLKMRTEAENEVSRNRNEANLILETAKRKAKEMGISKGKTVAVIIMSLLGGVALGVLSYVMLWFFGVGA